ncbi:DUF4392 domain-containing protein [Alkaliphilus peptidifermentans]|uniref:D-glutamate cyclase-like C-terminal domain-containing protein n=1 Tax=Alkaliphilus peptidifermentans DSM 18978 TaxID=1120976 RepID=A0A1G5JZ68_9FIRM|nr:DUF4392 domain-containing protein [Alkaliphilus peptidifermentans]SCY93484.1 protein of unknown function [Alkaliphilus peptidifermentans DSM 18978]
MKDKYFEMIENIVGEDIGQRGLGDMIQRGDLKLAVMELFNSSKVMIVTGFCIKATMTGETDGPMGAVSLANTLLQLGKEVLIITDDYSKELVAGCSKVLNINVDIEVVPSENTEEFCSQIIELYNPSLVVAIERPGRARDGRCYSMRGEDLSSFVPNTDPLFKCAAQKGIKTIAVGDGGNEMGMGKITSLLQKKILNGDRICAVTSSDYLIVAGVSNWGGHGIGAGLSILSGEMLLHEISHEVEMLEAMLKAGGVDGCSKRKEMTVDGLSLDINLKILENIKGVVEDALKDAEKEVC